MKYSQPSLETLRFIPAGHVSAVKAMLHFDRTGERPKPRLVVANVGAEALDDKRPRPQLRIVRSREPR